MNLSRAQAGLSRRFGAALGARHGLGFEEFALLFHLGRAENGRLRRVDLSELLGLTVSGVTRMLIPLEKRHIVTRQSDPYDARVAYAVLTEAGRQLLADTLRSAEYLSESVLADAPAEQVETVSRLLGQIAVSTGS